MSVALLPEKHVRATESLIGLGAHVLSSLKGNPKAMDAVWADLKQLDTIKQQIHGSVTLDRVVLAIDFLFAIGAVTLNDKGLLEHASA